MKIQTATGEKANRLQDSNPSPGEGENKKRKQQTLKCLFWFSVSAIWCPTRDSNSDAFHIFPRTCFSRVGLQPLMQKPWPTAVFSFLVRKVKRRRLIDMLDLWVSFELDPICGSVFAQMRFSQLVSALISFALTVALS